MSVGELNQLMTYVTEGWMLFSIGFIGIEFVSFVSKRIQEDIEADKLALKAAQTDEASVGEAVESAVSQRVSAPVRSAEVTKPVAVESASKAGLEAPLAKSEGLSEESVLEDLTLEDEARLEEVAAVSEKLAKTKRKQSDSPSVSVST